MLQLKKNLSLIFTIAVILILGIGGYYLINLKKGPYPVSTFVSVSYKWGVGDTLQNSYNSLTGDYQYLDQRDSLIKLKVKLNSNNMIFLHSKANELGLWQLPDLIANQDHSERDSVLRYEMTFNYQQKIKKIIFYTDYQEDPIILENANKLQEIFAQTLKDAEERHPGH